MALFVQKYGGSSLRNSEEILSVANRIATLHQQKHNVLVVVSAMGNSTNDLLNMAFKLSNQPQQRELDMLLSTGERVSMSLLSIALNQKGIPAISFTGSQAGLLTNEAHNNARIHDVRPIRVKESLARKQIVVLAGFQGVSPLTKEITTLGRGGSDTTAVAMAAHFHAERCEILKDVDAIYTADPKIVTNAMPFRELNYNHLLNMTFWGSKVCHFRSVELARKLKVKLFVGPSHRDGEGTQILGEKIMYEKQQILSVNSHRFVKEVCVEGENLSQTLSELHEVLAKENLPRPQILNSQKSNTFWEHLITGPQEYFRSFDEVFKNNQKIKISKNALSSVTATCHGLASSDFPQLISQRVEARGISIHKMLVGALSVTLIIGSEHCDAAIQKIHDLISNPVSE